MTEIPDRPFDKIAIDLVTNCETSTSSNNTHPHYYRSLNRMARSISYPQQVCRYSSCHIYNEYLPVHMCPQYILSDNGTEFKNSLMDQVLQQLGIDRISLLHTTPKVMENWKSFTSI